MTDQQLSTQLSSHLSPVWVVIPAAGIGQRMQSELPKQYLKIKNKTLIEHTLDCFLEHDQVAGIIVVLGPDDRYWQTLNIKTDIKPIFTVEGGLSRSDSVMQGLQYLDEVQSISTDSWIMVHDAARPCLSRADLDALLAIRDKGCIGGLLASPVRDTMKRATIGKEVSELVTVSHTEPRDNLWHALTPQMFRLGNLQNALKQCQKQGFEITDECSAIEFMGEKPIIIESKHNNIKVTQPSDIALATILLDMQNDESIENIEKDNS